MGEDTTIIPLLNGLRHIEELNTRFGEKQVFGGQCAISATLSASGEILHLNDLHTLTFGEQNGGKSERRTVVVKALSDANFIAQASDNILQEMWEKWVFIATGAGSTCLMRASVGDMVAAGASDLVMKLLDECIAVAAKQGFEPRPAFIERTRSMFTTPSSPLMASMLRDIERGAPTEGDHVLGDLLNRGVAVAPQPLLRASYAHVKAFEARRAREATAQ